MNLKDQREIAADALGNIVKQPLSVLGIDLDGGCDESGFFQVLRLYWPGEVVVITFRDDRQKTDADLKLKRFGIRYTDLVLVDSFQEKAKVVVEKGISVDIDDQPEMLKNIPPHVGVLLCRDGGHFAYADKKCLLISRQAKLSDGLAQ